jgi:hypothetical protein
MCLARDLSQPRFPHSYLHLRHVHPQNRGLQVHHARDDGDGKWKLKSKWLMKIFQSQRPIIFMICKHLTYCDAMRLLHCDPSHRLIVAAHFHFLLLLLASFSHLSMQVASDDHEGHLYNPISMAHWNGSLRTDIACSFCGRTFGGGLCS